MIIEQPDEIVHVGDLVCQGDFGESHSDEITCISGSSGNTLLTSSRDGSLVLWRARSLTKNVGEGLGEDGPFVKAEMVLGSLPSPVIGCVLFPQFAFEIAGAEILSSKKFPTSAVSACEDGSITHWEFTLRTGAVEAKPLGQHPGSVLGVCGASDGSVFASVGNESVYLWNPSGFVRELTFGGEETTCVEIARSLSCHLFVGTSSGNVHMIDILKNESQKTFIADSEGSRVNAVLTSPDASLLASATASGHVTLFDVSGQTQLYRLDSLGVALELSFCPTRYWLVSRSASECLWSLDLEIKALAWHQETHERTTAHGWALDGNSIFCGTESGTLIAFSIPTNVLEGNAPAEVEPQDEWEDEKK